MTAFPESARRRLQSGAAGDHPGSPLRAGFARDGVDHPDADLLTAFAEHALTADERDRVLSHLAACATCREVVALALPADESGEQRITQGAPSRFRWPVLRWTAMAAAVIVVGAAVSVLVPRRQEQDVAVPADTESAGTAAKFESQAPPKEQVREKATPRRVLPEAKNKAANHAPVAAVTPAPEEKQAAKPQPLETYAKLQSAPDKVQAENAPVKAELDALAGRKDAEVRSQAGSAGLVVGGVPAAAPGAPPPPVIEQANALRQAPAAGRAPMLLSKTVDSGGLRWRIEPNETLQRSPDGRSWENVRIDPQARFTTVFAKGSDVWVGGAGGALYHSTDNGQSWRRVRVGAEGMWVQENISGIEFPSAKDGVVTTASGAVWTTADGGNTWQRRQ